MRGTVFEIISTDDFIAYLARTSPLFPVYGAQTSPGGRLLFALKHSKDLPIYKNVAWGKCLVISVHVV